MMDMLETMIDTVIEWMKPIIKENTCYGVFRVTPKRKLLRLVTARKDKKLADRECDYLYKLNKQKDIFEVKKMSYILFIHDFILLDDNNIIDKEDQ